MAWFIKALSVSDCVGTTIDATSCVASDPPAYAGGLYWERFIQALSVSDGIPLHPIPRLTPGACIGEGS